MVKARHSRLPELKLEIWKKDGNLYYVEKDDLLAAIAAGGLTDHELKRHMGVGHSYIQDLLDGKRLSVWSISFVEHGILRHKEVIKTATWPPS